MNSENEALILLFFDVMKHSRQFAAQHSDNNSSYFVGQYRCMQILYSNGEMTQRMLADALRIRSTSLSELLAKLIKKGHVKRIQDADDSRTYRVSLTDIGYREAEEQQQRRGGLYSEILSPLSKDERAQFEHILQKIKEHYTELENQQNER